ncbi:glutathione S-transferase family protein [Sphingorhabdus sp. Alg239-R122]|uniref:glutathione S-transferase family protein n=1 Tax=Sphingorhabdus sp. Alg239-R122 TaxID=2305989 RepID=UPI0013DA5CA8|nr:glutathione S-transferase family protein [Sphingorhabdus sp. Alg239-R122]
MTYTLTTANRNYSSWSLRPWVLMRALDIPFDEQVVEFSGQSNFEEFRQFAPNGMVPCLDDDGCTVWDSLAILEYLAERHEGVWPTDDGARTWARCAAAEMHSGFSALRNICPMNVGVRAELHEVSDALAKDVARIAELWAEGLEHFGGPFLAGKNFTAVDAFYAPVAYRVRTFGLEVGDVGHGWAQQMLDHPAMCAWEKAALAETHRETAHEEEIAAVATVTADYRAK